MIEATSKKIGQYEVFMDKGSSVFLNDLDSIPIGKNISLEDARYPKFVLMTHMLLKNDYKKIATAIAIGTTLISGWIAEAPKMVTLCQVAEALSLNKQEDFNITKSLNEEQLKYFKEMSDFIISISNIEKIAEA